MSLKLSRLVVAAIVLAIALAATAVPVKPANVLADGPTVPMCTPDNPDCGASSDMLNVR